MYRLLTWLSPIPATSDVWLEVDDDQTGRANSLVYGLDPYEAEEPYPEHDLDVTDAKGTMLEKTKSV